SQLSGALANALPDASLSPAERLERLARVIQTRTPDQSNLIPAATKLSNLEARLKDLVADPNLTSEQRLNHLLTTAGSIAPGSNLSVVEKLETMGDAVANIAPVR